MSFKILFTPAFEHELKRLSKKHLSLKGDLSLLIISLIDDPTTGVALGNNSFKIRLAITSKNKGRSGGARVITYVKIVDKLVYLLSIYDKSESDTISNEELQKRIRGL